MAMHQTRAGAMNIDELVPRLREAYGDGLRCVLVYGSAVDGEATRGDAPRSATGGAGSAAAGAAAASGTNVLVLVDTLPIEALGRAAGVMREWVAAGHPSPLTLTTSEWRSSADVFAIEYADVLERHRVLLGALPTEGIEVRSEDIRRELEEQVLGALLKLRRGVMEAGGDEGRERTLLEVSLATFVTLFRAVVRLHGERPPADDAGLVERTGALATFDASPFGRVVRHVRGDRMLQAGETRAVLAGYLAALERLIAHLDQYRAGA
jgi:hypothetical protein